MVLKLILKRGSWFRSNDEAVKNLWNVKKYLIFSGNNEVAVIVNKIIVGRETGRNKTVGDVGKVANLILDDATVSRNHCVIYMEAKRSWFGLKKKEIWYIAESASGSKFGTLIQRNRRLIDVPSSKELVALENGDKIVIGNNTDLLVEITD